MSSGSPQRRSPSPQRAADGPVPTKQVACAGCRSIKVRCITPVDSEACKRCIRLEQTCERMVPGRPGRPRGRKNLQRAFHLIEREFDKAHRTSSPSASNAGMAAPRMPSESLSVLRRSRSAERRQPSIAGSPAPPAMPSPRPMPMLPSPGAARFRPLLGNMPGPRTTQYPHADVQASPSSSPSFPILSAPLRVASQALTNGISPATEQSCSSWYEGVDSVDDNEGELTNPVRLLVEAAEASARVSELSRPASASGPPTIPLQYTLPDTLRSLVNEGQVDERLAHLAADAEYLAEGLQLMTSDAAPAGLTSAEKSFFKPFRKSIRRELEIEYDPLARSLINEREACVFFDAYFQRLHPLLPVLDPTLHTMEFIHRRSLFLFSVICAHGASMTSGAEEATKRLRWHAQRLAEMINPKGYASVEIIQAFLIWSTWLPSSEPFQEERLWHEAKYAINMAVEIGLMIPVPDNPDQLATFQNLAPCFEDIDVADTLLVRRVIRNRERLWQHLFLWDSNLSLAFGKSTRFVHDDVTRNEMWCFNPVAITHDAVTTAMVVLMRRLAAVTNMLRSEAYARRGESSGWVGPKVDEAMQAWYWAWIPRCSNSPLLELLYRHTRLWCLCFALQLLSPRTSDLRCLQDACFAAALSSCEYACEQLRSSRQLWGIPNTIGPMLSFEVMLALRTFVQRTNAEAIASKARLLGLLSQLAHLLERVGTTPSHRMGTAAIYGRHLQVFIRKHILALCLLHHGQDTATSLTDTVFPPDQISFLDQPLVMPWEGMKRKLAELTPGGTFNLLEATSQWTDDLLQIFEVQRGVNVGD